MQHVKWRPKVTQLSVSIGTGNGLVPDGTKPITWTNVDLSSKVFYGIHLRSNLRDVLKISVRKVSLKNSLVKSLPYLLGTKGLTTIILRSRLTARTKTFCWVIVLSVCETDPKSCWQCRSHKMIVIESRHIVVQKSIILLTAGHHWPNLASLKHIANLTVQAYYAVSFRALCCTTTAMSRVHYIQENSRNIHDLPATVTKTAVYNIPSIVDHQQSWYVSLSGRYNRD